MQKKGNKFLTVFLTIIITLVLVAIVGFILVKTNVISFKAEVKETPSEKTEIGSVEVKKLIGKEYLEKDDKGEIVKKNFETDQIIFNNVPGEYIKSLNAYLKNKSEMDINNSDVFTKKDAEELYGLEGWVAVLKTTSVKSNKNYKDMVSLLVYSGGFITNGSGGGSTFTLNINLKTGAKITNDELLYMFNMNRDDLMSKMHNIFYETLDEYVREMVEMPTNFEGYNLFIGDDNNLYVSLTSTYEDFIHDTYYKVN